MKQSIVIAATIAYSFFLVSALLVFPPSVASAELVDSAYPVAPCFTVAVG